MYTRPRYYRFSGGSVCDLQCVTLALCLCHDGGQTSISQMFRWVKLPEGQYFPQWIAGTYCSGNNCSLPTGLTCEPILTYVCVVV